MKLNTYLNFDGDCKAAFEFYAQLLRGNITRTMTFGEAPGCEGISPESSDKIMHVCLMVGDDMLMGSDCMPGFPFRDVSGAYVTIKVDDPAEADRVFAALAEGGKVEMPIQETFWSKRYGITVDRFGVPWMVNCEQAP